MRFVFLRRTVNWLAENFLDVFWRYGAGAQKFLGRNGHHYYRGFNPAFAFSTVKYEIYFTAKLFAHVGGGSGAYIPERICAWGC